MPLEHLFGRARVKAKDIHTLKKFIKNISQLQTDIAMDSSEVILTNNDLNSIIKLINISKKTIRNIKQNLFWAFFYNCLMIPIAIGIVKPIGISINPMIASVAMVLSSITVILNALRLR